MKYNITPLSNKKRFLLKLGTGMGKTLCSLLVASNFIKLNKKVIIITFNKNTFINEILKFPNIDIIDKKDFE